MSPFQKLLYFPFIIAYQLILASQVLESLRSKMTYLNVYFNNECFNYRRIHYPILTEYPLHEQGELLTSRDLMWEMSAGGNFVHNLPHPSILLC